MCLILFAYHVHPAYNLVLAANRDEFHDRPTRPLGFWEDHTQVLAGRDLKGGGTWMGVTRSGRVAAITNYRDPASVRSDAPSRGLLISTYLTSDISPRAYLKKISSEGHRFNGFNLLVGDADGLYYYSNRGNGVLKLHPGLYGLSNHLLDTAWPKVELGKRGLETLIRARDGIRTEGLFHLLSDRTAPPPERLPETGVGRKWEQILAPMFIVSKGYGTRSSSVLLMGHSGRISLAERTFHTPGYRPSKASTRMFQFKI